MAFSFGLGSDTMLNQYQRDATQFKLVDMASNIQKYTTQVGQAGAYVDYTYSRLNRFMQQDQENDDHATFLSEYQALLRSRIQQMITDLTAALTRDLDKAMNTVRSVWDDPAAPNGERRVSAQGYSSDVEDAGAARMMYNLLTGFSSVATPSNSDLQGAPYYGIPTFDSSRGTVNKVAIDTQADATFEGVNAVTGVSQGYLRAAGTATIQQTFPEDGLTTAIIDNMIIDHRANNYLYQEMGGGFSVANNHYKFINPTTAARFDAQNLFFLNSSVTDNTNGAEGGNLNDNQWDNTGAFQANGGTTDNYQMFNMVGKVKNQFEQKLYDTIFELDQRNLLRDIMRLSEKDGLFNDIQIASTTSINTGSQLSASIKLNYIPNETGPVIASTANSVDVSSNAGFFTAGDVVYLTTQATPKQTITRQITSISGNTLFFASPPNAALPAIIANSTVETTRQDLGGRIQVVMDRCSAFYHS